MTRSSDRRKRSKGAALLLTVISFLAVLPMVGLAIDGISLYFLRARLFQATDAAALAATRSIAGVSDGNSLQAVANLTAGNFFAANFPTSFWGAANIHCNVVAHQTGAQRSVTVQSTADAPLYFMRMLQHNTAQIAARATAQTSDISVYVLGVTSAAFNASGSANVSFAGSMMVNSSLADAVKLSGGASLTATAIDIVGSYTPRDGNFTPTPTTGVAAGPDPFANLPAPSFSGCDFVSKDVKSGTVRLTPGVYCGGLSVGTATVTLDPGIYIMNGGGLTFSSSIVTGQGVMIFNTGDASHPYKPITLNGATVTLSAMTAGPYSGVLFFQDRSIMLAGKNAFTGSTSATLNGTLYLPTSTLELSGGAQLQGYTAIVAFALNFSGGAHTSRDPDGVYTGLGGRRATLTE